MVRIKLSLLRLKTKADGSCNRLEAEGTLIRERSRAFCLIRDSN